MRLRKQLKHPPAVWQDQCEKRAYDIPLVYRRTIALVKGGGKGGYFVFRDQYNGPEVKATYCLHGVPTVSCVAPADAQYERFDWSFTSGKNPSYSEKTQGLRLTKVGARVEFITVLGAKGEAIPGGVRVGKDEITFPDPGSDAKAPVVLLKRGGQQTSALLHGDIDMDRSQGKVALFVPEAGYDFGPIPDWLTKQRTNPIRNETWWK